MCSYMINFGNQFTMVNIRPGKAGGSVAAPFDQNSRNTLVDEGE